jgi:tetratricopeptide (TPR) repeat protein
MEAKGDQLMQEGDAALKKFSFGALFGGGSEKYEDASDKFKRAANAYKASKKWAEAARAFKAAAECFKKLKDDTEIAQCYQEASRMLIKAGSPAEATALLEGEALPRMIDAGRLAQAAKLHEEVAKMLEDEHEYAQAMEHFGKAADLFSAENSASTAQKAKQNVARLAALMEPPDYEKSSETYAECGMEAMASQLLKFGAKECFQRAVFCTLARNDLVTAQAQFEKFKEQDYTLEGAFWCLCLRARACARVLAAPSQRPPHSAAPLPYTPRRAPPACCCVLPQGAARASC